MIHKTHFFRSLIALFLWIFNVFLSNGIPWENVAAHGEKHSQYLSATDSYCFTGIQTNLTQTRKVTAQKYSNLPLWFESINFRFSSDIIDINEINSPLSFRPFVSCLLYTETTSSRL